MFWHDRCSGIRKYSVLIGPAASDGDVGSPVKVAYATPFSLKLAFLRLSLFSLLWRGIWRLVNKLSLIRLYPPVAVCHWWFSSSVVASVIFS